MPYEIELIALECNDAQEWFDEAYLLINGSLAWRYTAMQTGLVYRFGSRANFDFDDALSVELWEQDSNGKDDHIGTLGLSEADIERMIGIDHPPFVYVFSRDKGIVGDATYTLTYDIHPIIDDSTATSGRFYAFTSMPNEFVRHAYGRGPDAGYPLATRESLRGYPQSWPGGSVGATLYCQANRRFYLFQQDEYVRYAYGHGPDPGYPRSIRDHWSGLPDSWRAGFASALYYPGNRKFYLFQGNEYVRHSFGRGPDPGYPRSITEYWSGFPDSWMAPDIYAACYCAYNDKFYLFGNTDEYVRHSYGRGPDPNYPRNISEIWSGLPRSWRDAGFRTFTAIMYCPDVPV